MLCEFCEKICKNKISYAQHRIRCKSNPDRIIIISSFIAYNTKLKNKELTKEHSNQYVKAAKLGLDKPQISDETRSKLSKFQKGKKWSDERKKEHSEIMSRVVAENPEVYSNKQKRVIQEYNGNKFDSSWELIVAKYFDEKFIRWERNVKPFPYFWNDKWHLYFPDFYLPDEDIFVEVKGYKTDRDIEKWKAVENLIVFFQKEISLIRENKFKFDRARIGSHS